MLQDIRDNSQGVIAKIIIGLIVAMFSLFGVQSIIGGFTSLPPVAEVNGEEISEAQLQASVQTLLNSLGASADSLDQSLLEQVALGQIIEEVILRQSAQNASMSISSDRIDRSIIDSPQFQINGVFDPDLAIRTMASQGFSAATYRESLKQQMLLSQVASAYTSSGFVIDTELSRMAELSAQSRDFRYVTIPLGVRTLDTAISDAEIESYYAAHQVDFTQDETVVARYVLLDKDVIAEEIEVDESELRSQYEEERAAFEGSAEKRASHILFEVGANLSEEAAVQLANASLQRLQAGEDFAALALELSSDTGSAQDGGDIGYTDGSAFPEAVEVALEALALNEVSTPVVSEFGVHLVKLTEDSEVVFQSFEEVSERIERELKSAQVELIYAERLENLSNLAFESGNLEAVAEELNLVILQSEAFGRAGGNGIFSNPSLISQAFSEEVLLDGNNSEVIELSSSRALVLNVLEFNEASILPLEEVEPEIAVLLRTEMEREAVQALGDEILTALEANAGLDQLLADNALEWLTIEAANRGAANVNREILTQVFAMPEPVTGDSEHATVSLANGTFVLIELNKINPGTLDSMAEAEREGMTNAIIADLGNSDFQAFMSNLQQNADIESRVTEEAF
ncbi:MAG: SurA N-terminal domain-containing protein [Pseudohongiella sp.]|nr:SurA N-terminal domain-containing protein [Pseudohongiella sp.]